MIRLFHGTDSFFEFPDLSKCRPHKDFGKGFYLTPDLVVAKRMAERCVERSDWQGAPKYVYVYAFDDTIDYLLNELKFRKLTIQYSFHTKKALAKLTLKEVRSV